MVDAPKWFHAAVRTFQDRGYGLLFEQPGAMEGLVRMLAPDIAAALDFSRMKSAGARFVSAEILERTPDLVVTVPLRDGSGELCVYLVLEHQTAPSRLLPLRYLCAYAGIWSRDLHAWTGAGAEFALSPVVPILFYTGGALHPPAGETAAAGCGGPRFARFFPAFDVLTFELARASEESLTGGDEPLGWVLRVAQGSDAHLLELRDLLVGATRRIERLEREEGPGLARILLAFLAVLLFHRRAEEEYDLLLGTIRDSLEDRGRRIEMETIRKSAAESYLEKGIAKGRAEGRAEVLLEQLRERFEEPPRDVAHAIEAGATPDALVQVGRALVQVRDDAELLSRMRSILGLS
jgi:predicted transposase YdaD